MILVTEIALKNIKNTNTVCSSYLIFVEKKTADKILVDDVTC
jgi:hypothetical protein